MKKLLILLLTVALVAGFAPKANATVLPEVIVETQECVEVSAPDPISFSKKIGFITFGFKWFEEPEGTWKLYKDIDPRGGHEYYIYAGETIVENHCVEVEIPEEPTPPSPFNDGGASDSSATKAPAPKVCTVPFEVARTWYSDGQLFWASDEQGVQKFSITYGPSADQLNYGIDNIPAGTGIRSIAKPESDWNQTWFSVWTWKDDCANQSTPIDP